MKRKNNIRVGLFLLLILGVILIPEFINKKTVELNEVNSKIYKAPANSAFKDQNFYNCVIKAYNETHYTYLENTAKLTDEQLATIEYLSCDGEGVADKDKIVSVAGIEKLTKVTYIFLPYHKITEIDVSKNTLVEGLFVDHNSLTELKATNNSKLVSLYANDNKLIKVDISGCTSLPWLEIQNNQLSSLDISNNTKLETLSLANNNLEELDISKNLALKWLDVKNNKLTKLDLSLNANLGVIYIQNNPYAYDMVMYLNESKTFDSPVKFSSQETPTLEKIENSNTQITINNNSVKGNLGGKYQFNVSYKYTPFSSSTLTYSVTNTVYVIEITSDKYEINNETGTINTYLDKDSNTILNNIKVNYGTKEIKDNKLIIKYDNKVIKEFNIVNGDFGSLKIDEEKKYILDIKVGTKVSELLAQVNFDGELSVIYKDKQLKGTDVVKTGSKLKIESNTKVYEIVVVGDANGDGQLSVLDIVKINNHIVYNNKKLEGVYALATDYNKDNKVNIQDIVKINNIIVGGN